MLLPVRNRRSGLLKSILAGWLRRQTPGYETQQEIRDLKLQIVVEQSRANVLEMIAQFRDTDVRRRAILLSEFFRSQRGQDLFALVANNFQSERFYVEVGAAHGEVLSNTWMLEHSFDWKGLLVEPSPQWDESLAAREGQRDMRAVTGSGGPQTVEFEMDGFSTSISLEKCRDSDLPKAGIVTRDAVPLGELLKESGCPQRIDFLSIDIEGSEWEALTSVDFDLFSFGAIAIEHNWGSHQSEITSLLEGKGYAQVLGKLSVQDSWFVPLDTPLERFETI